MGFVLADALFMSVDCHFLTIDASTVGTVNWLILCLCFTISASTSYPSHHTGEQISLTASSFTEPGNILIKLTAIRSSIKMAIAAKKLTI